MEQVAVYQVALEQVEEVPGEVPGEENVLVGMLECLYDIKIMGSMRWMFKEIVEILLNFEHAIDNLLANSSLMDIKISNN